MAFKDILLTLASYPDPTPGPVVDDAVAIAAALGAHIAAMSCEVHVEVPGNLFAGKIIDIPGMVGREAAKSRKNAEDLLAAFKAAAEKAGVQHETILAKCPTYRTPALLVGYARLRDLTIMPVPESYDQWYAEAIIFGSGRPTLVLPENSPVGHSNWTQLPSPGTSAARRRARYLMPFLCLKGPERYGSSRSSTKRCWTANTPPRLLPGTSRVTASRWSSTASTRTVAGSAKHSKPTPSLTRSTCS